MYVRTYMYVRVLLEEVISEPLIHSACLLNQNHTLLFAGLFVLSLKSVRCRWRLVPRVDSSHNTNDTLLWV